MTRGKDLGSKNINFGRTLRRSAWEGPEKEGKAKRSLELAGTGNGTQQGNTLIVSHGQCSGARTPDKGLAPQVRGNVQLQVKEPSYPPVDFTGG